MNKLPLESLSRLPANDGHRFGTVTVGFDKINVMRDEFLALRDLAAVVCGVEPELLSLHDLSAMSVHIASMSELTHQELLSGLCAAIEAFVRSEPAERRASASYAVAWMVAFGQRRD